MKTSKHVATIKQDIRFGMLVWVSVMCDWYQFKIIGHKPGLVSNGVAMEPDKWQVQWLSAPGSFWVTREEIRKTEPK